MNVPVAGPSVSSRRELLARLAREHFPGHELSEPRPGVVAARFRETGLTSAFQPIVRSSDGGVAGHHALIRVNGNGGDAAAPWKVFAQAADDADLVQLDRMCRTVHALNYFPKAPAASSLFLNIEQRLLNFVSADHGAYFEAILAKMNVPPGRVTIVMPAAAGDDPVTFVRAAISYRIRGYRVLAQLRATSEAHLAHLFLADPHYVAIDAGTLSPPSPKGEGDALDGMARLIATLSRRGIHTIARRIESAEQAQAARDVGFGFLQGWHFAPASERP